MKKFGWEPIHLQSKEGLALINGTQFMSAYGMYCLKKAEHLLQMADLISALSFDAFDCTTEPLDPHIHAVRAHKGQVDTAAVSYEITCRAAPLRQAEKAAGAGSLFFPLHPAGAWRQQGCIRPYLTCICARDQFCNG
jgi:histidine ammonia-lyase